VEGAYTKFYSCGKVPSSSGLMLAMIQYVYSLHTAAEPAVRSAVKILVS